MVAAAWLVVATAVGVLVGRMIRERDRQVPPTPGRCLRSGEPQPANRPRGRTASEATVGRPLCIRGCRTPVRLCHRPRMASSGEAAAERVLEQEHLLNTLLAERDGLLSVLDRVLALHGTARLIRDAAGADAGFVADIDGNVAGGHPLAGRQPHRLAAGPRRADRPGRRRPGAGAGPAGAGQRLRHRPQHHPPVRRRGEPRGACRRCSRCRSWRTAPGSATTVAVAYAALRGPGEFGDDAVRAVQGVAADAARALRLADRAAAGRATAVAAERQRMQASLHDSVGAMLFSIGAQVRDLRSTLPDNPLLRTRLGRLESDVSAASLALREALLALAESSPERALPIELAEHCRSFEARTGVPARLVQLGAGPPAGRRAHDAADQRGARGAAQRREARRRRHRRGEPRRGGRRGAGRGGRRRRRAAARRREAGDGAGLGIRLLAEKAARLGGRVEPRARRGRRHDAADAAARGGRR